MTGSLVPPSRCRCGCGGLRKGPAQRHNRRQMNTVPSTAPARCRERRSPYLTPTDSWFPTRPLTRLPGRPGSPAGPPSSAQPGVSEKTQMTSNAAGISDPPEPCSWKRSQPRVQVGQDTDTHTCYSHCVLELRPPKPALHRRCPFNAASGGGVTAPRTTASLPPQLHRPHLEGTRCLGRGGQGLSQPAALPLVTKERRSTESDLEGEHSDLPHRSRSPPPRPPGLLLPQAIQERNRNGGTRSKGRGLGSSEPARRFSWREVRDQRSATVPRTWALWPRVSAQQQREARPARQGCARPFCRNRRPAGRPCARRLNLSRS